MKLALGKKHFRFFIGYKEVKKDLRPSCIYFPKMKACKTDFDETECMSLLMKEEEFLEKYNDIWEKFSNIIKKEFNGKPAHNKKYLKTEKKSYNEKINTKEGSQCIYISIILTTSVYIKVKNYYPQVFLEKYKYIVREKRCHILLLKLTVVKKTLMILMTLMKKILMKQFR